jgi:hypothetical protein
LKKELPPDQVLGPGRQPGAAPPCPARHSLL